VRLRSAWGCISSNITTGKRIAEHGCWLARSVFRFSRQLHRNHALHGDTIFPVHGAVRTWYLSIWPVTTPFHRRVADGAHDGLFLADGPVRDASPQSRGWTFPIWLYVSITGVVVFLFLRCMRTSMVLDPPDFWE